MANIFKTITIHVNHYEEDSHIYNPIIKQLVSEGWVIDKSRNKKEIIGINTFFVVWLDRKFEI